MSSFGDELRRERELRRISLREIAEATKINVRYLDALERNDFEHLPGGVFNRGFVRAYSQYIGVDPEDMVNAYLLEERSQDDGAKRKDRKVLRGAAGETGDPGELAGGTEPVGRRGWRTGLMWTLIVVGLAVLAAAAWAAWWYWGPSA
jgi:cytoskeletal protein RodZ